MCDLTHELLNHNTLDVMHCEKNLDVKMSWKWSLVQKIFWQPEKTSKNVEFNYICGYTLLE